MTTDPVTEEQKAPFVWIAELFCALLLLLLPLKFGAITAPPSVTMIYWSDPAAVLTSPWPFPVFPPLAAAFLCIAVLTVPSRFSKDRSSLYTLLWLLLTVCGSAAGCTGPSGQWDTKFYFFIHGLALGCFLAGFMRVLLYRKKSFSLLAAAWIGGLVLSLIIGGEQYFSGFRETAEMAAQQWAGTGSSFDQGILQRLREARVSAGFSACNAYAGYLVLAIPTAAALLWKAGEKVEPVNLSPWVLTLPVTGFGLYLLLKTGSRGAVLALAAACFLTILMLKIRKSVRIGLLALIPCAILAFCAMIFLGRGAKSILFRMDYCQGAFRIMLDHPLTGCGWGGFQRLFMFNKMICDAEAPASPHNLILTFGSQTGALFFLIAAAVLLLPILSGCSRLRKLTLKEAFSGKNLFPTLLFTGYTAWCIHAMQDVLYETPAAAALGAAAGGLILILNRTEEQIPSVTMRSSVNMLLLVLGIGSLAASSRLLVFDHTISQLNDMLDPRLMSREEWENIDPGPAMELYRKCRTLAPKSPFPDLTLSSFCAHKGQLEDALRFLDEGITLDPGSSGLRYRKYNLLRVDPSRKEEALAALRKASELFPMNPKYREELERSR